MPINRKIRGIRDPIPSGYIIGRTSAGSGDAELIHLSELGRSLVATGTAPTGAAALADSGVTAGSYTCTNLTVTAKGIITAASNGGMLPLVNGDTFFGMPVPIDDGNGNYIGVPL